MCAGVGASAQGGGHVHKSRGMCTRLGACGQVRDRYLYLVINLRVLIGAMSTKYTNYNADIL